MSTSNLVFVTQPKFSIRQVVGASFFLLAGLLSVVSLVILLTLGTRFFDLGFANVIYSFLMPMVGIGLGVIGFRVQKQVRIALYSIIPLVLFVLLPVILPALAITMKIQLPSLAVATPVVGSLGFLIWFSFLFGCILMLLGAHENSWRHLVAWICVLFAIFPLYLVILSAFSTSPGLQSTSLIPRSFVWDNFAILFTDPTVPYMRWMLNSAIIAGSVSLASVAIGAASAFGFSRLRFKGKRTGLQALLLIQMFPSVLALSAIYVIMERVHVFAPEWGLGTAGGLVLVYLGGSMGVNIWLMKGFVDSIPLELDEAAKVDGASAMQTYWQIFLPLARPILAIVTLLSFIGLFNEYVMARLFLPDVNSRTVAVGLQFFIGGQYSAYWGPFAAGSLLASVPIIIVFMSLQRYIIGGLTAGSVKG